MTEKELQDLGFEKVEVLRKESDNNFDYYYYTLKIGDDLHLTSTDSKEIEDKGGKNQWFVYNYEWSNCTIPDAKSIQNLKEMYASWKND
jgi:hypothetical protein